MACGWLEVLWIMIWIRFSIFWIRFKRPHLKMSSKITGKKQEKGVEPRPKNHRVRSSPFFSLANHT